MLMRMRLGGWGRGAAGMREVHSVVAGDIRLGEFSKIKLVKIEGYRSTDFLNFFLDTLPFQSGPDLLADIAQFPVALRFEPLDGISRAVGQDF
jgi:hypothetical protein